MVVRYSFITLTSGIMYHCVICHLAVMDRKWLRGVWPLKFKEKSPSIAACELFLMVVAVILHFWSNNQAVVCNDGAAGGGASGGICPQ